MTWYLRFQLSALCSQLLAGGGLLSAVCGHWSAVVSARVAELADALDLGSSGETLESSSLSSRTTGSILF
jgi:hypothetical protein